MKEIIFEIKYRVDWLNGRRDQIRKQLVGKMVKSRISSKRHRNGSKDRKKMGGQLKYREDNKYPSNTSP